MKISKLISSLTALLIVTMGTNTALATVIWGNNATGGGVTLEAFDTITNTLVDQFLVPNATAVGGNGRGIALLGTTLFYTTTGVAGDVFVTDSGTHADLGILFSTGFAISTIATDGSFFYITPYTFGSSTIEKYDMAGVFVSSVNIAVGNSRDGAEIVGSNFIVNRGDAVGPYDLYDSVGNLLQAAFITTATSRPTGIAWDGTNFFVSDIFNNQLEVYDAAGVFLNFEPLGPEPGTTSSGRLWEDLAVQSIVAVAVPEPGTLALLGLGLFGMGLGRRRKKV